MKNLKAPTLASVRALAKSRGMSRDSPFLYKCSDGWQVDAWPYGEGPGVTVGGMPTRAVALRALAAALREMPEVKP